MLPDWLHVRRHGEARRLRWCLFYAAGCALVGISANRPWLFGRAVTIAVWTATAIMFVVVGFRPGFKRRRTLVVCLSTATAIRAFGSLFPDISISDFVLRGSVYLMLAIALIKEITSYPIREIDR